jgi:excisionase family DNA binding protein
MSRTVGNLSVRIAMSNAIIDGPLEPLALSPAKAAAYLAMSKRTLSRLIRSGKIDARKAGPRTLVDVASLKAYYASLPKKTDHASIGFGRRAHVLPRSRVQVAPI